MNDTFRLLQEHADLPVTRRILEAIDDLLDNQEGPVVMAALAQALVSAHLTLSSEEDGAVCVSCANASLTELFQAMRGINDAMLSEAGDAGGHGEHGAEAEEEE